MTSRERVIAALRFSSPDRAPRDLWALPYVLLFRKNELDVLIEKYPMDIGSSQRSPGRADADAQRTAQVGTYTDEWGSIWHVAEPGVIGEVKACYLRMGDLATFQPPGIVERDLSHVNRMRRSDEFMFPRYSTPFERLQFSEAPGSVYGSGYGTGEFGSCWK
jgi:hypothetical protein